MSRISAIRTGRKTGKRVNVFLDGQFAFSLEAETVARHGLSVGRELSDGEIQALHRAESYQRCMNAATRFLSLRPRSEFELRDRLLRQAFDEGTVKAVMDRLKDQGLVDDVAFARFWQENRDSFSPRSQWLVGQELTRKGVAADIVAAVVKDTDDDSNAYRAALGRARRLPSSDYETFRRRLGDFLKRRGFGYELTNRTVRRLWRELKAPNGA